MRDAFGGLFLYKWILIFIVIYVSFMCLALNYARAFRVKNRVVNILEQYQFNIDDVKISDDVSNVSVDGSNALVEMDRYLSNVHYLITPDTDVTCKGNDGELPLYHNGVCIVGIGDDGSRYYKVTTYIVLDFPFFGLKMTLPVRGETKTIVY